MFQYDYIKRILTFKSIIQITTIVGFLLFFVVTWSTIYTDYPYESWDELHQHNASRLVFSEYSSKAYRYGSLDTGQNLIANWWYDSFDIVGKVHPVKHFSNSVKQSFFDDQLAKKPKIWEHPYFRHFRGLSDRYPIFISRHIHFVVLSLLILGLNILLFVEFGRAGAVAALVFLQFLFLKEFQVEAVRALPSMQNVILMTILTIFLVKVLDKGLYKYIIFSLVVFAAGLNLKIDCLFFIFPLGFAISSALYKYKKQGLEIKKKVLVLVTTFVGSLFLFKPSLFWQPVAEIKLQLKLLFFLTNKATRTYSSNLMDFNDFASFNISQLFNLGDGGSIYAISFLIICVLLFVYLYRKKETRHFSLIPAVALLQILFVIGTGNRVLYLRYFLYGWSLLFLSVGICFGQFSNQVQKKSTNPRYYFFLIFFLLLIVNVTFSSFKIYSHYKNETSAIELENQLSPSFTRNLASVFAIQEIEKSKYSKAILVDQHSYMDLRIFYKHNLKPIYINKYNYKEVLEKFQSNLSENESAILLVVPGQATYLPDNWMGHWDAESQSEYQSYLNTLSTFKLLKVEKGDKEFELLYAGPVPRSNNVDIRLVTKI